MKYPAWFSLSPAIAVLVGCSGAPVQDAPPLKSEPVLSVAQAHQALLDGKIYCYTDKRIDSNIHTRTICDPALHPMPTGDRVRYVLTQNGLYEIYCSPGAGCAMPNWLREEQFIDFAN